ncbi:MAG: tetratricopeptide repeat protein, partial [Kiritimatiellae bacterium]|nr:tetratricopeptide repeat protein [Kiritimatiellia bacterium]
MKGLPVTIAHWPKWTTLLILSACLLIQSAGAEEAQDGKDAATAAKDWVEKARGAVADNDMQTALEYLKQGLAEYPDNFALRSELGTVCLGMGSPDKAIAIWEDLQIKNNRDPSIKNNLAWIYATETDPKIRNPEKAVVLAREALQLLPLSHQVWNTLTTAYHAKGDYTFAA